MVDNSLLQTENQQLRKRILELEEQVRQLQQKSFNFECFTKDNDAFSLPPLCEKNLSNDDIQRYARQLIMHEIGVDGQRRLRNASVLIVGAGGLGAPSSLYLAGAGVGRLGIVDFDDVELNNLHRQVIHSESSVGIPKSVSAKNAILRFNSSIECIAYNIEFNSSNALKIIEPYDLVVDATDNVATRYLINDACVLLKKPLVSGSALRMEGQVTVYNYEEGPCYRCLFPNPPPPETVTNCSDGGVLGVIPGIIGCIEALEAIKIITKSGETLSKKLLLFDGMVPRYQVVKLRGRNTNCVICGDNPTQKELIDYVQFCGSGPHDKTLTKNILSDDLHISPLEYKEVIDKNENHVLLDVRSDVQFKICSLPNSINIPLDQLPKKMGDIKNIILSTTTSDQLPVYVVCRRGNDSQDAVNLLKQHGIQNARNMKGGLIKWSQQIDPTFPMY